MFEDETYVRCAEKLVEGRGLYGELPSSPRRTGISGRNGGLCGELPSSPWGNTTIHGEMEGQDGQLGKRRTREFEFPWSVCPPPHVTNRHLIVPSLAPRDTSRGPQWCRSGHERGLPSGARRGGAPETRPHPFSPLLWHVCTPRCLLCCSSVLGILPHVLFFPRCRFERFHSARDREDGCRTWEWRWDSQHVRLRLRLRAGLAD